MDAVIKKLEDILDDENGFFMKIRFLEGCDQEKLNDVLKALKDVSAITADGASIKLLANIADPEEM